MPRSSRLTEMPQRQCPRGPPSLRTSSSESGPLHHRPRTDRSPRLSDGRSPRGAQSDPVNKKKLGTRIADLESQLGQAQDELKSLKDQLASAEAAKKAAQEQLEEKSKKQQQQQKRKHNPEPEEKEVSGDVEKETDVFEVPVEEVTVKNPTAEVDDELKVSAIDELALKKDEVTLLKNEFEEKGKELEAIRLENEDLKSQVNQKSVNLSSVQSEIAGLTEMLSKADREVETSKAEAGWVREKLEASEKAREELENEMKRLRVQTEQWRKAADAAASVLAGDVEMSGRRISERCGSMDKHYYGNNVFEPSGGGHGVGGCVGSSGLVDDLDDVYGSGGGKRKGSSGIRMLGDLWKKKGNK